MEENAVGMSCNTHDEMKVRTLSSCTSRKATAEVGEVMLKSNVAVD
jgi:hypothetical protein